jgi:hypothetical protein
MRIALNPCSQKNGWKSQIVLLSTEDIEKAWENHSEKF